LPNLFQAVGVWRSRSRTDESLINDAARLLADCREKFPAAQVRRPSAAILLKRLALIKFVPALGSGRKNDAFRFQWREGKNNLS
jgi:hypothetical protein